MDALRPLGIGPDKGRALGFGPPMALVRPASDPGLAGSCENDKILGKLVPAGCSSRVPQPGALRPLGIGPVKGRALGFGPPMALVRPAPAPGLAGSYENDKIQPKDP